VKPKTSVRPRPVVLDSGAVTFFAEGSARADALLAELRKYGAPVVLSPTLLECLPAPPQDANVNRFLKRCRIEQVVPVQTVRLAALARHRAGRGSALDALVVAFGAECTVVTGDRDDFRALAAHVPDVTVVTI
jgi:hypothetical protein